MKKLICSLLVFTAFAINGAFAKEHHVSVQGNDKNDGSASSPLRTIMGAARIAQPGDTITVHEGIYRERINPPRGGESDEKRITYQAAPGEKVIIKGSETIKGWKKAKNDTWCVTIPNRFFGDFNPYNNLIAGDWFSPRNRLHHTGEVYSNGYWLTETTSLEKVLAPFASTKKVPYFTQKEDIEKESALWFAQVNETETKIWAQFKDVNPNETNVEINVRQTVFYPERPGINYITVRGFTLEHAATPWAPPTAEQIGLIGTHWSKGWILENNVIRFSKCVGLTLGKYGDQWDNTSQDTAKGYVDTIHRALKNGWSKENIGHHLVRNNHISHCEQAGIVGSLGAVFSKICNNEIHHIYVRQLFAGAEMAGIKIHGAIDTLIQNNHVYRSGRGIWLDWMAQGTRVSSNLLHHNVSMDLFSEVNHGPFVVDNNLFLSKISVGDWSEGCCFTHNLFAGKIHLIPQDRQTPYHKPHSTAVEDLYHIRGGDNRYINNIFIGKAGLDSYEKAGFPSLVAGNAYLNGAKPYLGEKDAFVLLPQVKPDLLIHEEKGSVSIELTLPAKLKDRKCRLITNEILGKTQTSNASYENYNGKPLKVDMDYFGRKRNADQPAVGPFENYGSGKTRIKVR